MKAKDRPLRVSVSRGVLTIEIGVDTLASAYLRSDHAWSCANPKSTDGWKPEDVFRIKATAFARDVKHELLDEAEDGSSPLTRAIDAACAEAVEQGSDAFVDTRYLE